MKEREKSKKYQSKGSEQMVLSLTETEWQEENYVWKEKRRNSVWNRYKDVFFSLSLLSLLVP